MASKSQVIEEIKQFMDRCESMKNSNFIMAPTKINDIMKCIASSEELYSLFTTITKNFDYNAAKRKCVISVSDGMRYHQAVELPENFTDRLAYIFCLLVEIEKNIINFSEFLSTYYYVDGSYYASYQKFCSQIIDAFSAGVYQIYEDILVSGAAEDQGTTEFQQVPGYEKIKAVINDEREKLSESDVPEDDKQIGQLMLDGIFKAIQENNEDYYIAMMYGYTYYAAYYGFSTKIMSLADILEETDNGN